MGEARKKAEHIKRNPCVCRSGVAAQDCCYRDGTWRKNSARVALAAMPPKESEPKCYMRELGSCGGGISGEHLVSKAVLQVISEGGNTILVRGAHWQKDDKFKAVGIEGLTANCLCRDHNSALSGLDTAAAKFCADLRSALDEVGTGRHYIASGHDIERWLLKCLKAMAVSGNLRIAGIDQNEELNEFVPAIDIIRLLDDPASWPASAGLYCESTGGVRTATWNEFQLQPIPSMDNQLCGVRVEYCGLKFALMLLPLLHQSKIEPLRDAVYRPGQLQFDFPNGRRTIDLSWEDGRQHPQGINGKFLGSITEGIDSAGRRFYVDPSAR